MKTLHGAKSILAAVLMACAGAAGLPGSTPRAAAEGAASAWVSVHASKVRLIAGGGGADLLAGVEIVLGDGWKTYWRSPGDAGGVPPFFDWTGSENLKEASVLYPAPSRLTDKAGDSIGYKGGVIFPVRVTVADPSRPAMLRLKLEYGICKDICVPAEAELTLPIAASPGEPLPEPLRAAVARVPGAATADGPQLAAHAVTLSGAAPRIALSARFPGDASRADVFAEASGGVYLPMPKRTGGESAGVVNYEIDLTGLDVADLKGQTVTVTLVSPAGQSETRFKID